MTFPNRLSIPIPMSKKSKKIEEIKKHIKNKYVDYENKLGANNDKSNSGKK